MKEIQTETDNSRSIQKNGTPISKFIDFIKSSIIESANVRAYMKKVLITESKPLFKQKQQIITNFDLLEFKYINLLTTLININSFLFVGGAFAKLRLSWKFIGILLTVTYVNLSWNLKIVGEIVKNKINSKDTAIHYWHQEYFRDHIGQLIYTNKKNSGKKYLSFEDIYTRPVKDL